MYWVVMTGSSKCSLGDYWPEDSQGVAQLLAVVVVHV